MTPKAFKAEILRLGGKIESEEDFSTNNAWGFGGMYGKRTKFILDGMVCFLDAGKACFRHLPPEPCAHAHVEDPQLSKFGLEEFLRIFSQGARTYKEFIQRQSCNGTKLSEDPTTSSSSSTPTKSSRKTRVKAPRSSLSK